MIRTSGSTTVRTSGGQTLDFKGLEKEYAPGYIPIALGDRVREKAAKERRTLSEVTSELLCRGLGINPREFGIEPAARKTAASA